MGQLLSHRLRGECRAVGFASVHDCASLECNCNGSIFARQANSEVSALLGRIPSAVGYQPTLATDLGTLQERITTTDKGSITSVQVGLPQKAPTNVQSLL